jgi:CO/xanthine dehydrogenase FAD-binding subunit
MRAKQAEQLLVGKKLSDELMEEVGLAASEEAEPIADIHASEEYRRHLVKVLTGRMVKNAWEKAAITA